MIALVFLLACILAIFCMTYKRPINTILLVALALRLLILAADLNHWFPIFGSGTDTEAFNHYATIIAITGRGFELTHYTPFVAYVYSLTDCSRLFAQFVNVYFGMGVLFCAIRTMSLLNISTKRQIKVMWILALLPNLIIFSGILLREAWVEFFVALSLLQFTKWYLTGSILRMFTTIASVCLGIYMHDGVIAILIGYFIAFTIYSPQKHEIRISAWAICMSVILLAIFITFSKNFSGEKGMELANNDSASLILKYSNTTADGNSAYLTWLPKTSNPLVGLIFAPLKMLFFMFSPLPTEWHRTTDIIAFLIDSLAYITMWYIIFKNNAVRGLECYKRCLMIALLAATFMFSYGTFNAGTAMRHRAKFCEPIAIVFAVCASRKNN
ncbi:MAG: hypothetical protein NC418_02625 [Muribaculaceae bacterium]|nr:hypothetical protein [Muribaculaceae bacterium]